ncbi:MAG: hypothetical protein JSS10_03490 [Verrucomicrobia bacterium]|nr:hypothetical protein [Verrucomicrobiota bacterium]
MTHFVQEHPVTGIFVISVFASKLLMQKSWFSRQIDKLDTVRANLESGKLSEQEQAHLKKQMQRYALKLNAIQGLSRLPLFPMMMGIAFYSLEGRVMEQLYTSK